MTPEQIIEEYRTAFVAALGVEVGNVMRITHFPDWRDIPGDFSYGYPDRWEGHRLFGVAHAYYDLDGRMCSGMWEIYPEPDIIAATQTLRARAEARRLEYMELHADCERTMAPAVIPPIIQRADGSVLGALPVDNGAFDTEPKTGPTLWGIPATINPDLEGGARRGPIAIFGTLDQGIEAMRTGEPLRPTFDQLAKALCAAYDGLSIAVQPDGRWLYYYDAMGRDADESLEAHNEIRDALKQHGYAIAWAHFAEFCISGQIISKEAP